MKFLTLLAAVACGSSLTAADEVTASREGKQVVIRTGSREILRYQAEPGELPRPEIPAAYVRGATSSRFTLRRDD